MIHLQVQFSTSFQATQLNGQAEAFEESPQRRLGRRVAHGVRQ